MPSPFTPIADYAFLSDCHTGALVAPDGAIDWLCVPKFDSPSIFGSLLDRQAGQFRFGPFAINVPTARAYEAGTNTLVTTWHTPGGWAVVRDALTLGPRDGDDSPSHSRSTSSRRPTRSSTKAPTRCRRPSSTGFLVRVAFGYPGADDEWEVLERRMARRREEQEARQVVDAAELLDLQATMEDVTVSPEVGRYCVALARATREHANVLMGTSPAARSRCSSSVGRMPCSAAATTSPRTTSRRWPLRCSSTGSSSVPSSG